MGNKNAAKTTSMIDQERQRQMANTQEDRSYVKGRIGAVTPGADALRDEVTQGYRKLAGGMNPSGGAFGSMGGGYNAKLLGLDPSLANLEGRYQGLSGGLDKSLGGYEEFAKTGGISDADRSNIRSRGAETGSALFSNLRNEMQRKQQVAGGYSPGMTASSARMAREQSIAAGKGARDTEMDISNQVRQGRLAGLGGMERIGGAGYAGLSDVANQRQGIAAQNINAENQAAAHNASAGQANSQLAMRAQLEGLGGMESMYGAKPGQLGGYEDMLLKERGLGSQEIGGTLQSRMQNVGQETSPWDRVMQGVGAASGLASAFYNPIKKTQMVY